MVNVLMMKYTVLYRIKSVSPMKFIKKLSTLMYATRIKIVIIMMEIDVYDVQTIPNLTNRYVNR